jgi:hypothetical protein
VATPALPLTAAPEVGAQRLRDFVAVLGGMVLTMAAATAALWPGLTTGHDTVIGNIGDPSIFIWDLQWVPFALGHHLNPLVTTYLNYPAGANLMWNTSIIFPALLFSPLTLIAGPILTYNLVAVVGMGLSGGCAFLAIRRYTERWVPAFTGGLLYEFCPYMMTQITGHAHLFIAIFPPLLMLFADEILVRQRRRAWLMGLLLGLAAACQLLTGTELLTISMLMAVPALITLGVIFHGQIGERLRYALRSGAVALVTFGVLAAYPLYILFLGPQRVHGILQGTGFVASPPSFVVPSSFELIAGPSTVRDSSVYIGLPLMILALVVTVWMWRRPAIAAAGVTVVCAMVLALGGHLRFHGTPPIPLPWDIAQHVAILDNVLAVRLMVAGYLALALLLAIFLDRALRWRARPRLLGITSAVAALIPLIPSLPISAASYAIPGFFTDGSASRLSTATSVLMVPYGGSTIPDYAPEVWQALSGFAFRTQIGMVFTPGAGGHRWGPAQDLLGVELHSLGDLGSAAPAELDASLRDDYLADLRAHEVEAVVVGPCPGEGQAIAFLTELLRRPGTATGGVVLWMGVPG